MQNFVVEVPFVMIRKFVVEAESAEEAFKKLDDLSDRAYDEAYQDYAILAGVLDDQDEVWGPLEGFVEAGEPKAPTVYIPR